MNMRHLCQVSVITSLLCACGEESHDRPSKAPPSEPKTVQLIVAQEALVPHELLVDGSLHADQVATVGAVVSGRLDELLVDLGSRVEPKAVIARLDPGPFRLRLAQAQAAVSEARSMLGLPLAGEDDHVDVDSTGLVRQAQAALLEAQANLKRRRSSLEQGLIGESELEPAVAQAEIASGRYQDALETIHTRMALLDRRRADAAIAARELKETEITAPFAGAVLSRLAAVGQYLSTGSPVIELVKTDPLRLILEIPELDTRGIAIGQSVHFESDDAPGKHLGKIVRMAPGLREASRTLRVEAEVANEESRLRPGSFVRTRLALAERAAVVIPASAVRSFAGVQKIARVQDGQVVLDLVRTGRSFEAGLEIVEGLASGTLVVLQIGNLVDGERVTVAP